MADEAAAAAAFGPNAWLVDDMFERYSADPSSVAESWRDFFEDYRPSEPARRDGDEPVVRREALRAQEPPEARRPAGRGPERPLESGRQVDAEPLRGAAARLALNMEASL